MKAFEPTEFDEQVVVIDWWAHVCGRYQLPEYALFAVPNGAILGGNAKLRAIQMSRLKATGLRPGAPDLVLAVVTPVAPGLYIEMKRRTKSETSPAQLMFADYLRGQGYHAVIAKGADEAMRAINGYLGALRYKA